MAVETQDSWKSRRLRLRLRDGADPLLHATGGRLTEPHDPYQLIVESDRYGVAEYFVDEVRSALLLDQVPAGPVDAYLLPGPSVPLSVSAGDGTAGFDGERIRLEWNWKTEDAKAAAGARTLALADITALSLHHEASFGCPGYGHRRFQSEQVGLHFGGPAPTAEYDDGCRERRGSTGHWGLCVSGRRDPSHAGCCRAHCFLLSRK
ncbi:DUF4429 domain-containing protein [Streptomyces massasporeus]